MFERQIPGALGIAPPVCQSELGYKGSGRQWIWLTPGVCSALNLAHEIGHTLGLRHEHQRTDRDEYVDVNTSNLVPLNFGFAKGGYNWGEYDYSSIMHYPSFLLNAPDPTVPTFLVKDCTTTSGTEINPVGVPCNSISRRWPNNRDPAAALRANHGADPSSFRLRNRSTNRCLRPSATGYPESGDDVYTSYRCQRNSASREWYTWKRHDGTDVLINKGGRVCLYTDGSDVRVENCTGPNTQFQLKDVRNGYYYIKHGTQCVQDNGDAVVLTNCKARSSRQWEIVR